MVGSNFPGISTGTVGAISELVASVHLMKKGYSVFRAVSPASPFDLCAFRENEFLRVEVTSGVKYRRTTVNKNGKNASAMWPREKFQKMVDGRFDLLLVVFGEDVLELTANSNAADIHADYWVAP